MRRWLIVLVLGVVTLTGYLAGQKKNPPGFYLDESSIAYNALTIARSGHDEWGVRWPFYFRAFGEYKNPVYIYLLSGVFRATHPSILVARRFSALLGYTAAVVLGLVAFAMTRRRWIGWTIFLLALTTPQLFEVSRLVFEVALFPLAIALFLFLAYTAARRERWSGALIAALAASLALITFTYSTGRMLGLLFALALFLLGNRRGAAIVLAAYVVVGLAPLLVYNAMHPGALTGRIHESSLSEGSNAARKIGAFEENYAANLLPLGMTLSGDPNPRHHVPASLGAVDLGLLLLDAASIVLVLRRRPRERWWLFVLALLAISAVPASLFDEHRHALRLIPIPVLLLVLAIPALESAPLRKLVVAALILCAVQSAWFFTVFARHGASRRNVFDAGYPHVLRAALAQPLRPIYLVSTSYIHAYWYGTLDGVPLGEFAKLDGPLPKHAMVVGSVHDIECSGCTAIARDEDFAAWITPE